MRANRHFQIAVMVATVLFFVWSQPFAGETPDETPVELQAGELEHPECLNSARVPQTGQTFSESPGEDGDLLEGVEWPEPRFTDTGDGTVKDNLTGLVWLKDANCGGSIDWYAALTFTNSLYDGWTGEGSGGDCGLDDNSVEGDWRLPNVRELQSLIHYGYINPALPNTEGTGQWTEGELFTDVASTYYWSSTTDALGTDFAWLVNMGYGLVLHDDKVSLGYVWPVRSDQ